MLFCTYASIKTEMTLSEQYELLSTNGKFIEVRIYYNHAVSLYLLDDIFFEAWYFKPYNMIERIDILEEVKTVFILPRYKL